MITQYYNTPTDYLIEADIGFEPMATHNPPVPPFTLKWKIFAVAEPIGILTDIVGPCTATFNHYVNLGGYYTVFIEVTDSSGLYYERTDNFDIYVPPGPLGPPRNP